MGKSYFVAWEIGEILPCKTAVVQLNNSRFSSVYFTNFPCDKIALPQLFEFRRASAEVLHSGSSKGLAKGRPGKEDVHGQVEVEGNDNSTSPLQRQDVQGRPLVYVFVFK